MQLMLKFYPITPLPLVKRRRRSPNLSTNRARTGKSGVAASLCHRTPNGSTGQAEL